MGLEEQFDRTLQFIARYGQMRQEVTLPSVETIDGCCEANGNMTGVAPATSEHPFARILPAEKLHIAEVKGRIKTNIPSTERNAQLIEVCADTGIDFAYSFADRHPNMPVDLVGIIKPEDIGEWIFYNPELAQRDTELGIRRYRTRIALDGPITEIMAKLFAENGMRNTRYHGRDLEEGFENITLRGKERYVVGFRCTALAATQALEEAITCDARAVVLTNSAMPTVLPKDWKPLSSRAKAAPVPYTHAMELLHDPNADNSTGDMAFKYDYTKPADRMRCFSLKQLRILDMALLLQERGYTARVYALEDPRNYTENAAEHVLYGFKPGGRDILRPLVAR